MACVQPYHRVSRADYAVGDKSAQGTRATQEIALRPSGRASLSATGACSARRAGVSTGMAERTRPEGVTIPPLRLQANAASHSLPRKLARALCLLRPQPRNAMPTIAIPWSKPFPNPGPLFRNALISSKLYEILERVKGIEPSYSAWKIEQIARYIKAFSDRDAADFARLFAYFRIDQPKLTTNRRRPARRCRSAQMTISLSLARDRAGAIFERAGPMSGSAGGAGSSADERSPRNRWTVGPLAGRGRKLLKLPRVERHEKPQYIPEKSAAAMHCCISLPC